MDDLDRAMRALESQISDELTRQVVGAVAVGYEHVTFEERLRTSVEHLNARPLRDRLSVLNMMGGGDNEPALGVADVTYEFQPGDPPTVRAMIRLDRPIKQVYVSAKVSPTNTSG